MQTQGYMHEENHEASGRVNLLYLLLCNDQVEEIQKTSLPCTSSNCPVSQFGAHHRLTQERLKCALPHGKLSTKQCHAIGIYTCASFSNGRNVDKINSHGSTQNIY